MLSKRDARHAQESERGMGGTRGGKNESDGTSKLGGTLPAVVNFLHQHSWP